MTMTLNNSVLDTRPSMVAQTYGLLSMGLILAVICSVAALGQVLSFWELVIGFVASIAFMIGAMVMKHSFGGLVCYFGFVSVMGYLMGPTISQYLEMPNGATIVMQALGATAVTTVGLSLYAFASGRSFNQLGGFLFAGLIAVVVASIANIFFASSLFSVVIAGVSALVFSGYILYDTGRILSGEVNSPVEGAISMFLNVINLFTSLLRLFGFASNSD
jgi:modulator of FtsH protease